MNKFYNFFLISLVSSTPLLEIYRSNYFQFFEFEKVIFIKISLLVSLLIGISIFVLDWLFIKNIKISLPFSMASSLFFFFYKDITNFINGYKLINSVGFVGWLSLYLICLYFIFKFKNFSFSFTIIFFSAQTLLLIWSLLIPNIYLQNNETDYEANITLLEKPDIYFFLIDNVVTVNNFDNIFSQSYYQKFNNYQKTYNFNLFEDSLSSYAGTAKSIASILNIDYVLQGFLENEANLNNFIDITSQNTLTEQIFIENGYSILKYGINFPCRKTQSISCFNNNYSNLDTVTVELFNQTPLLPLINKFNIEKISQVPFLSKYFEFSCIEDYCGDPDLTFFIQPEISSPKLYLVHLMNLHNPFLLSSECENINPIFINPFENSKPYLDAFNCFLTDLDAFLENIDKDSIVIFQSDHGITSGYEIYDLENISKKNLEQIYYHYQTFSFSNILNSCNEINKNFGGPNTFAYLINCLSDKNYFKIESKAFYIDENLNVIDISKIFP